MFTLYRGQVKHFDNMPSGGARAEIRLHLNDEKYAPKGILLQEANRSADDEKDIVFRDRQERMFPIYVRINTSSAGNKIVIYSKNVLLCHTKQSLEFFYQKKTDIFAEDNANEFPQPVIDNRSNRQNPASARFVDMNSQNEPTIYIHQENLEMCAALSRAVAVKSELVPINTPGSTGQFEIADGKQLYQFQCSTATY